MKFLDYLAKVNGYECSNHFLCSAFHPTFIGQSLVISSIFASLNYYFEKVLGINLPVGILIIALFGLELFTGIRASIKEGRGFSSEKFQKGWLKLFVYMVFIACSNLAAKHIPQRAILGISFNIYDWVHYLFYNYIVIQLFISNLENFMRLGWGNFLPIIDRLGEILKLNKKDDKSNKP